MLIKSNSILKGLYFITSIFLAYIVRKPVILCFHRVKTPSKSLLDRRVGFTSPNNFKKVIRFMKIMGYEFVSLEDLVNMIQLGKFKKVAVITFDDGFKDLYHNAYPILKEFNIPFTLFLITSLIDSKELLWLHKLYISLDRLPLKESEAILKNHSDCTNNIKDTSEFIGKIIHSKNKKDIRELVEAVSSAARVYEEEERRLARDLYLSMKEIEEMKRNGLTVETHGHEHWPLKSLDKKETIEEIESSLKVIKEKINGSPKYLALQYGKFSVFIRDVARMLGLRGIATMQGKIITEASLDPYSLHRFCLYDDLVHFYRALSVDYIKYIYMKICKSMKIWQSQ